MGTLNYTDRLQFPCPRAQYERKKLNQMKDLCNRSPKKKMVLQHSLVTVHVSQIPPNKHVIDRSRALQI